MSNSMSVFWQLGEEDRRLNAAKRQYEEKVTTYSARNPAYKGTVLQARHGGEKHEVG